MHLVLSLGGEPIQIPPERHPPTRLDPDRAELHPLAAPRHRAAGAIPSVSHIFHNISWTIGNTPLMDLPRPEGDARLLGKLEYLSPSGGNKDRGVIGMLRAALRDGILGQDGTVVECSAGDLGIALAMHGRAHGLRVIITLPECMASNRCDLVRALGAEIELTDSREGIRGALARAEEMAKELPGAVCLQPFTNRANATAHEEGTAAEIWRDTNGQVDAVVCPVGTGGTAAGCAAYFARRAPAVRVFGVEPASSPVISGGEPGPHNIPGLGAGFVPGILNPAELAGMLTAGDRDAARGVQRLARDAAICAGPAAGAVFHGAWELARRPEMAGKTVVAILPDSGERYVEHPAYQTPGEMENP